MTFARLVNATKPRSARLMIMSIIRGPEDAHRGRVVQPLRVTVPLYGETPPYMEEDDQLISPDAGIPTLFCPRSLPVLQIASAVSDRLIHENVAAYCLDEALGASCSRWVRNSPVKVRVHRPGKDGGGGVLICDPFRDDHARALQQGGEFSSPT